MNVLVACEYSGRVRDAFIRAGHVAMSCDFLETESPGPHYRGDVRDVVDVGFNWHLLIAHPPCTRLTNAGVRWLKVPPPGKNLATMYREMHDAVAFYKLLRSLDIPMKAIENPVMHGIAAKLLGSVRRQLVQPWWFGEPAFKATGFELVNLPDLMPTRVLVPPAPGTEQHKEWSAVHRAPPGPDRWKFRSRTFSGVAEAMASQWGAAA